MPTAIATPDEVRRMSWRQRARALAAARAALEVLEAECGQGAAPDRRRRKVGTGPDEPGSQGKATPPSAPSAEVWGAVIRGTAKRLLKQLPPDPDAELHRHALYIAAR